MNFSINRSDLYQPLQKIINIISSRPKLPVLSYILLKIDKNLLFMTATNLEIEITVKILLDKEYESKSIMISGRKLFEICHNLPEHSKISLTSTNNKIIISSEYTKFYLSTIPTADFPKAQKYQDKFDIIVSQLNFKKMIKLTQFAMAKQDPRIYLNGMFFETINNSIRMIATDGYRLAMSETIIQEPLSTSSTSIIIPRKSIQEILNLLNTNQVTVKLGINENYICMQIGNYTFNSQLIDAKFPNYRSVFPKQLKNILEIDRITLKQALKRAAILVHVKHRIVNLHLKINQLKITTYNFDQDTFEEILNISYSNEEITISFNIDYLLDIITIIDSKNLKFYISDSISSVQIEGIPKNFGATYIIMPIRI